MEEIVIIGGGVSGLMASVHLAERGLEPHLLEADPTWIGGRLKDSGVVEIEQDGQMWPFPAEHGVHGIWLPYLNFKHTLARLEILPSLKPAVEEVWIFGRGKKIRKATMGSAIRRSGIPAPFHYLFLFLRPRFLNILTLRDLASMFRVIGSLFAAMSIDPVAEFKSLKGMSLADFTAGWSPTLRSFFAGLARNALAGHPEDVPAAGFIAFLRFYTLLRRDAWQFSYLPGPGGTCVTEPLAQVARNLGTKICLGARVINLERIDPNKDTGDTEDDAGGWRITYERGGQTETIAAKKVILALDAPATDTLLKASPTTATLAQALWYPPGVPTAIIRLWFKIQPKPIAEAGIFSGDFVVDNFFWLEQLQPAYQAWQQATGGSAIEMHIYGPPELLAQPDAILLAQVITDTYRAFPELRGQLLHSVLQRNEASHTLFSIGEPDTHLSIKTPWPKLYACGDWVYHPAPALYLERATTTGIAAANAVLTDLGLEEWLLLPHPQPEWLAGKLEQGLRGVRKGLLGVWGRC